jgi:hypothetical protein
MKYAQASGDRFEDAGEQTIQTLNQPEAHPSVPGTGDGTVVIQWA